MKKEIWVAGYPSFYGGADTELMHQIDLWRSYDVDVNLVPMFICDEKMQANMEKIGCTTHHFHPGIFKDKIVASWCNGEFLKFLPKIYEHGKPAMVLWANCMTFPFDAEKVAIKNEWITRHMFVSNFQRGILKPVLEQSGRIDELEGYRPYFNPSNAFQQIEFKYNPPSQWFSVGRISRDDGHKYAPDTWNIFYKVCTPKHKKVFMLGYGPNAHSRCGKAPDGLDWQTFLPSEIPVRAMYGLLHCIIHKTGGSRESYCRIVPEAMAYGVPLVVEDDFAFPELIENGVTGYRCKSSDEMSFRASELAFDEEKRKRMIFAAREHLVNEIASRERCWKAWSSIF